MSPVAGTGSSHKVLFMLMVDEKIVPAPKYVLVPLPIKDSGLTKGFSRNLN